MGETDPNFKRLGILLMVLCFMLFMYSCKSILLDESSSYEELTGDVESQADQGGDLSLLDAFGIALDFIGFMFGLFFLQLPSLPIYLNIFIVPFYSILLFVFWYIVLDYAFDISKVVSDWIPFT